MSARIEAGTTGHEGCHALRACTQPINTIYGCRFSTTIKYSPVSCRLLIRMTVIGNPLRLARVLIALSIIVGVVLTFLALLAATAVVLGRVPVPGIWLGAAYSSSC